ncbi:hypothetical protein GALL_89820 [mine drainage metagenome]|uniref:Uncharacterized protein n=1 Tax=mine drainage metagenome TaxID=410659 RepID=A0A1J5SM14_9ZZZZ
MVSLDEIKARLPSRFSDDISAVERFEDILLVLGVRLYPIDQLDFLLQAVESILPIVEGFDQENSSVWTVWDSTIKAARYIINASGVPASKRLTFELKDVHSKRYPFACCLTADPTKLVSSGLLPAKALLLIAHYRFYHENLIQNKRWRKYHDSSELISSKQILSCLTSKSSVYDPIAKQMLPAWPSSSFTQWKELFLDNSKNVQKNEGYQSLYRYVPDRFVFIRTLRYILDRSSCGNTSSPNHPQEDAAPEEQHYEQRIRTSVIAQPPSERESLPSRDKRPRHPAFAYFRRQTPDSDSNAEGLAPRAIHVIPQPETPSDQPTPLHAVQSLDVRYSNYRTAMDNQRLPWQWDCVNAFEIKAVRAALLTSSERQGALQSEKHGAFIVWLLLTTGQTIEEILHFGLGPNQSNRSTIVAGPIYIRNIIAPPHSFVPKSGQKNYLHNHSPSVALALPSPFPTLATELGLVDSKVARIKAQSTIGACLNLDNERAEQAVRSFLENHRTRSFRLLPGRIRNVLSKEIMRVANDPVATHILSSLPTDMPPSGVYYTTYSKERLESIYAAAVAIVLGGDA